MTGEALGSGVVLGFGGTNARFGVAQDGELYRVNSIPTPENPDEFFGWMAQQVLESADWGHKWVVAGLPGPVSPNGLEVGPMTNVPGLASRRYNLTDELVSADSAMAELLRGDFSVFAVNDGELAAQAAATRIGESQYEKTAALILGTGVGAGVVTRDIYNPEVYRADRSNPNEIGHILLSDDPIDTYENNVSGPAIEWEYAMSPSDIAESHEVWEKVGKTVGKMATLLGLMEGVKLVVPCGGVGSGASKKYWPHLEAMMRSIEEFGNEPQKMFLPEIKAVPSQDAQIFELFGGEAVMRDFTTRR